MNSESVAVERETVVGTGIEVSGVSVALGEARKRIHVLDDVTLHIPRGEFWCIIGPSGCGKSTLLSMLAGFVQPSVGRITLAGEPVRSPNLRRAVVFQEYALFPWLTAVRNVEFGLESQGVTADRRERALAVLERVGLADFADTYPHELSGGMQQRVAIARALACEPEFLLMDEPLGALDALTRDQIQELIGKLWQQFGQTVVYVTHNVYEAVYLADRVVVFTARPGKIKSIVDIDIPRPRDPANPRYGKLIAHLRGLLTGEVSGDT
ncbi:ABC transporter ATP-binding protein [Amycolatopsis sp. K13G38]|uniref:ABC transporter ATP-binding protein n=1 Tax=Amycolatopsis acididurans TaxID=2724524 RepID=A0ABX1JGS3_9PSEU|nr:ABC transporter ATP-binding protein [Amycolatopsis acididurans]NKQ58029.1 ABC transporter ATP-binding protein [Amycolatopsis acididurans]